MINVKIFLMSFLSMVDTLIIECGNYSSDSIRQNFSQPDKLKLPNDYEVTIRFTNWKTNSTAKIIEKNYNGTFLITKYTREYTHTIYQLLNNTISFKKNTTLKSEYNCHGNATIEEQNLYEISPILSRFLNVTGNRFSSILSSVITNKIYNFLRPKSRNISVGIDTVGWVGCAEDLLNKVTIQANVYLSVTANLPYNKFYNNPQVFTIYLQSFKVYNKTNVKIYDNLSFDIVTLDKTNLNQRDIDTSLPRGFYCYNITKTNILFKMPVNYNLFLKYFDKNEKIVNEIQITYNNKEKIFFIVSDFKKTTDLFFSNEMLIKKSYIVHDFKYGIQYILNKNSTFCDKVESIDKAMPDVFVNNSKLYVKNITKLFLNLTNNNFYYAGKVQLENNMLLDSYVSKKNNSNNNFTITEFLYFSNNFNLNSSKTIIPYIIKQYQTNKFGQFFDITTIKLDLINQKIYWFENNVYPCLNINNNNNMFFISLNTTINKIKKIGLKKTKNTLIEAIAKTANISVLRITDFLFTNLNQKLLGCFVISEASGVREPAKTAYLQKELMLEEVIKLLNNSINAKNILKIKVLSDNFKDELIITSNEFGNLHIQNFPPFPPYFNGYSASSMFVLGVFMFIFGMSFVIGSYFFYINRQNIRGWAYQVLE